MYSPQHKRPSGPAAGFELNFKKFKNLNFIGTRPQWVELYRPEMRNVSIMYQRMFSFHIQKVGSKFSVQSTAYSLSLHRMMLYKQKPYSRNQINDFRNAGLLLFYADITRMNFVRKLHVISRRRTKASIEMEHTNL